MNNTVASGVDPVKVGIRGINCVQRVEQLRYTLCQELGHPVMYVRLTTVIVAKI